MHYLSESLSLYIMPESLIIVDGIVIICYYQLSRLFQFADPQAAPPSV